MSKNLWVKVEDAPEERTPEVILREQAEFLTKRHDPFLEARVNAFNAFKRARRIDVSPYGNLFGCNLEIVAPRINYYTYEVLKVAFDPVLIYPVAVFSNILGDGENRLCACDVEDEFMSVIGKILSSDKIAKVIEALLAQSKISRPLLQPEDLEEDS